MKPQYLVGVDPLHPDDAERFGNWIHDNVLQVLEYLASGGVGEIQTVEDVQEIAADAVAAIRASLDGLIVTARQGMGDRLADIVRHTRSLGVVDVRVGHVDDIALDADIADGVVGAVREALRNVVRHSGASMAAVECRCIEDCVYVSVVDDGVGFDSAATSSRFGLAHGIRERMRRVGGDATIESVPGDGTCVTVHVPVHRVAGSAS